MHGSRPSFCVHAVNCFWDVEGKVPPNMEKRVRAAETLSMRRSHFNLEGTEDRLKQFSLYIKPIQAIPRQDAAQTLNPKPKPKPRTLDLNPKT